MAATFATPLARPEPRPLHLAVIAGLACAFVLGKALPSTMDAISAIIAPLCASSEPAGSTLDTVEPIGSYALPNVPGKRVTIVRVFYGPGGFTRAHRHAGSVTAYVTRGEIRSQLGGGFDVFITDIERLNATFRERLSSLTRWSRALARQTCTLRHGMYLIGTVDNCCPPHAS